MKTYGECRYTSTILDYDIRLEVRGQLYPQQFYAWGKRSQYPVVGAYINISTKRKKM
jgi:hypothetical protein